jgi:hypothetical protein
MELLTDQRLDLAAGHHGHCVKITMAPILGHKRALIL